jgi:hypothetical protein
LSDRLQFLVDEHVTVEDAPAVVARVVRALVNQGWIASEPNEDCVLSDVGYRPGPNVRGWYTRGKDECDHLSLATNGVSVLAQRFTNLAYPYDSDLVCPSCAAAVEAARVASAIGEWMSGLDAAVRCDHCQAERALHSLRCPEPDEPQPTSGNLVVTLYNWPALGTSRWKRSIVDDLTIALGARPSFAYSRL